MQRDLISKERTRSTVRPFEHLDGAHAQIRKFANAAGLSQGKPEWIEYAAGADDTRGRRRRTLLQYFWDVDWTSSWDVARVLRFFELVLATLELSSLESDAILKPLERDCYTFENSQLKPKTFVDSAALENVTPRERLPALRSHLRRIEEGLVNDPPAVVGSAKELIDTVCKVIWLTVITRHHLSPMRRLSEYHSHTFGSSCTANLERNDNNDITRR
jgi:hypothetical protein